MKIGLIIYGSLESVSGGYLYDRKLVQYLQQSGDQVEILSLPWRSYALRLIQDNFSSGFQKKVREAKVDLLLQDELNHPSLFSINHKLRKRLGCPIISIVHHLRVSEQRPAWQNALYGWVERQYLSTVDGFIFNSQTTRRTVKAILKKQEKELPPHLVAYPAGDRFSPRITTDAINQRAHANCPFRILFLGNVIHRKGLHVLLQALESLPEINWALDVAGSLAHEPGYARNMQALAARPGLNQRVKFLGALDDTTLAKELASSHVLVVPSSYEGYGIAYLEGMSYGLPAIATTNGAAGEIITHGVDGFLVPPGQPEPLAEVIRGLADDPAHLTAMSLAARQRYLAQPTWQQTTEMIRKFLVMQVGQENGSMQNY